MRLYPLMQQMVIDMQQHPMRFLTVEAVAKELSVHTSTVRRLIDAGTLTGVRLGDGDGRGAGRQVRGRVGLDAEFAEADQWRSGRWQADGRRFGGGSESGAADAATRCSGRAAGS
jgi:excisionase family DNA binding protein